MEPLRVTCPECGGELLVDSCTGAVLSHNAAETSSAPKDFEGLFRELDASKARAEQVFEQEKRAYEDRDRLLEARFREALKRVEETDDGKRPERPFDLD